MLGRCKAEVVGGEALVRGGIGGKRRSGEQRLRAFLVGVVKLVATDLFLTGYGCMYFTQSQNKRAL